MDNINVKNHSIEKNEELTKEVKNVEKPVKRKRVESPYLKTCSKARNIFRNQIDKSPKTKIASIERAFNRVTSGNFTFDRFLAEFKDHVERLLDSKRFDKDCEIHGLEPFNAATHIAFDGTSKIDLVLKNGLKAIYSIQLNELVEPLFTEQELKCATEPECEGCPASTE